MQALLNRFKLEAQRVMDAKAPTRLGTVSSYDPDNYAVKVILQPDGTETGFIPITALMVGAGWGIQAAPSIGDQVQVTFQEDGHEVPMAVGFLYDNTSRPNPVPSGEIWMVHKSGASIKLLTEGGIAMKSPSGVTVDAPALATTGNLASGTGATGTFSSSTGQVVTVSDGIVTNIK